jgi:2-polyprenyl-3-methyl-5-hydroxy-6-metoxy-1,4-benzoquinol methylase
MTSACQNCDSTDTQRLYSAPGFDNGVSGCREVFDLGRCRQCHLVSAIDVTAEMLDDAYAGDYYGTSNAKFSGLIESVLAGLARRRARKLIDRWQKGHSDPASSPAVLDIGAGRGVMLRAFRSLGADVLGLERSQFDIPPDMAGHIVVGTISDPVYDKRCFDMVLIWHVLEHIDHAGKLLADVAAHMKEGALLVIAVPNYASLQQQLFRGDWFHLDLPRHILHFDARWLTEHLQQSGFDVELASHLDIVQGPYGFIQSALNRLCPGTELNGLYAWLKRTQPSTPLARVTVLKWVVLATLLAPFALAEAIVGALAQRGACVTIVARRRNVR